MITAPPVPGLKPVRTICFVVTGSGLCLQAVCGSVQDDLDRPFAGQHGAAHAYVEHLL